MGVDDGPGVGVDDGPGVGVDDGPGVGVDDGPGKKVGGDTAQTMIQLHHIRTYKISIYS